MNFFKITLITALFTCMQTSYPDIGKYNTGWNFSFPETSHHHTVEMLSKISALRLIACSMSIAGLMLIKQSISPTTNKDDHKKISYQNKERIFPCITGIILTGTGICSILYDHKWLAYFIKKN
ncbi:MAG: hypothetical protein M1114_03380 [Candidatus Dependentiae bacterium]|nr:hypothetical protein [Candidatus Dependentiae bacterium]